MAASTIGASRSEACARHHQTPRSLLRLYDRAMRCGLVGEGVEAWLEFERVASRYGVDVEICREDLAALVEDSVILIPAEEQVEVHMDAGDFARWGRRGGLTTLRRYGTSWFAALARRRWKKLTREQIAEAFAEIARRRG